MSPFALPQILLLPPGLAFAHLRQVLAGLGFSEAEGAPVSRPLIEGEPEFANWTWYGQLPVLHYSFNAVVRLRLLDVSTAPPEMRAQIVRALDMPEADGLRAALRAADDRQRLYGAWAAAETARTDLIHDLRVARAGASDLVAGEIDTALHRLGDLADARFEMLAASRLIAQKAFAMLPALGDRAVLMDCLPTRADFDAVFHPSIAAAAHAAFSRREPPKSGIRALPETADDVHALPAGALRWQNELSEKFVNGYRHIAGWLEPDRIWVSWTGREADGGYREMDGLVYAENGWVWMPRIYRELEPLILQPPKAGGEAVH